MKTKIQANTATQHHIDDTVPKYILMSSVAMATCLGNHWRSNTPDKRFELSIT